MIDFLVAFSILLSCLILSYRVILYYQLASYQFFGLYKTLVRQKVRAFVPSFIAGFAMLILSCLAYFLIKNAYFKVIISILNIALGLITFKVVKNAMEGKNKLVFTHRVKRFYALYIILSVLVAFLLKQIFPVAALICILAPIYCFGVAIIASLPENLIKYLYYRDAKKILKSRKDLKIVGITGSYGKTSIKFYLQTILSQKYSVLCTRRSGNTPMALVSSVRNDLLPSHSIFIAEMGARHRGDIRELTRLARPDISILSSVGPQHLETFKSLENIKETKYDIIRALDKDGFAIFGEDLSELYDRCDREKAICGKKGQDYWAEDIISDDEGTSFRLCSVGGDDVYIRTRLKGSHAIRNILICAACAKRLGLTNEELAHGIYMISPVKNRFKIEKDKQGAFIINNGFNSNPVSSRETLYELSKQDYNGRKIIITPGFVELGKNENEFHREFGENISRVADIVLLVGPKHTKEIHSGLELSGFDMHNVFTFDTLKNANAYLTKIKQEGDYVLYENDLTESYSEKEGIL